MEKFDLAVIGAGPGGYPAAIRAAQEGASVALIEKEKLGGTCLNWGCIPTKSLIFSSSMFWNMSRSDLFGIKAKEVSFDYTAMVQRKSRIVDQLGSGIAQLLKANGITVLNGTASFNGRNQLRVKNNGADECIDAANIIIATGSTSVMPNWVPKSQAIVDSRGFLELSSLPDSCIIIGGGVIGCEFACMIAQLGIKVTIVEVLPDILPMLDADVRQVVRKHMEDQLHIRINTGKPLEQIKAGNSGVNGQFGGKNIKADMMIVAIGRRPESYDLSLNSAGVKTNEHGFIETDENCQTSAASVYAIGDVAGGPLLAHFATAQGIRAAELITGTRARGNLGVVPSCIFTAPEIGSVGLSEEDAKKQNRSVISGKFSFAASGKAMIANEAIGFVKWITDAETDQLLGAQVVGPHASDLIAEAATAIEFELTASELARTIHGHPTLSEVWMEAAHAVHGQCVHAPPKKRKGIKKTSSSA